MVFSTEALDNRRNTEHISDEVVQTVFAAKRVKTTKTFSCTATDTGPLGGLSSTAPPALLTLTLKLFVLVICVICYCMATLDSTCTSVVSS